MLNILLVLIVIGLIVVIVYDTYRNVPKRQKPIVIVVRQQKRYIGAKHNPFLSEPVQDTDMIVNWQATSSERKCKRLK